MDWIITVFLILQIIFHDINIATLVGADLEKVQLCLLSLFNSPFPFFPQHAISNYILCFICRSSHSPGRKIVLPKYTLLQ